MPTHAPAGYVCPFCLLVSGADAPRVTQADIVYRGGGTTAFVAPKWWASTTARAGSTRTSARRTSPACASSLRPD